MLRRPYQLTAAVAAVAVVGGIAAASGTTWASAGGSTPASSHSSSLADSAAGKSDAASKGLSSRFSAPAGGHAAAVRGHAVNGPSHGPAGTPAAPAKATIATSKPAAAKPAVHGTPAAHGKPAVHGKPAAAKPAVHGKPAARHKPAAKPKPRHKPAARPKPRHKAGPAKPYRIYDSVTPTAIPGGVPVATYADGPYQASWASVAGRGDVLWIDVNGGNTGARALDVEPGDATPATAAAWAAAKLTKDPHSKPIVYTMRSWWPAVQASMSTLPGWMHNHIKYWIADPTGYDHILPGADATQWYWGKSFDITTAKPGFWK